MPNNRLQQACQEWFEDNEGSTGIRHPDDLADLIDEILNLMIANGADAGEVNRFRDGVLQCTS